MKLAIVHYHLERGGVAQVIFDQLTGLAHSSPAATSGPARVDQVVVLHGGTTVLPHDGLCSAELPFDTRFVAVEGLAYDQRCDADPRGLAQRIRDALTSCGMTVGDTLIHVHNHSLGKNTSLPGALWELAQDGFPMVLQLHDFVEDQRPAGYEHLQRALGRQGSGVLYPQADHVHYAVLNHRDRSILLSAGFDPDRVHLLPNGVAERSLPTDHDTARHDLHRRGLVPADRRFVLVPARGIRRKNLGEALVWSALFSDTHHLGFTLPPTNEAERPNYDRWVATAGRLGLPCTFGLGADHAVPIGQSLAAADVVLTTSVAEGFGLCFLEAPLARRSLVGRDLPEITKDFVEHGVSFPGLHDRLDVPVHWFGASRLARVIEAHYQSALASYGHLARTGVTTVQRDLDLLVEAKLHRGLVDFADLDRPLQHMVLAAVVDDPRRRRELRDHNGWMTEALEGAERGPSDDQIDAIRIHYSVAAAAPRLSAVYEDTWSSPSGGDVHRLQRPDAIVSGFLRFDRFRAVLA